ncbi:hypothetical protein Ddye_016715 [Dipteronia dyeriana]|uniref:Endonuclease/exonuclease/phosphatase domain-containing protein n=1 Tax=Dipteronia dyeriana TaxID=168575 RepID=A0AAD9U7A3_9ROSI|nr:hypothetical protein Ddye_016715 [Dipteronia dyeriana]
MNVLVWNALGMESDRVFRVLLKYKQDYSPSIIFLIETKPNHIQMEAIRVKLRFVGKLVVNCEGNSGGLCLLWTNTVNVSLLSFSRFHIDVRVSYWNERDWRFMGFYGNPDADQQKHGWNLLQRLHGMAQLPWLCSGNFNEILSVDEKLGGLPHSRLIMEIFRDTLEYSGFDDLGFQGLRFTWSNKQTGCDLILKRLDRGVCNSSWY